MLSKKDIALLRGIFNDMLHSEFDAHDRVWEKNLDQRFSDFKHEVRDEIASCVKASESALIRRMDTMQEEILDVINDGILPQIDEHTRQISVINRHLKLA